MAQEKNKVKYNLRNVHYATFTVSESGEITFNKPIPIPGAVSVSLSKIGDISVFYADGIAYYVSAPNSGYDGDLEIALIPEQFEKDCIGTGADDNDLLYETTAPKGNPFALLFEFEGDVKCVRHCLYFCHAVKSEISSQTKTETNEPVTDKLKIKATPSPYLEDKNGHPLIQTRTGDSTAAEVYANWYKEVQLLTFSAG